MKRTAIVTGAAGGIGMATVKALTAEGWSVVALDVLPEKTAREIFINEGVDACYLKCDISDAEQRIAAVRAASDAGEIRLLANVAGVAPRVRADILQMSEESFDRVMGINAKGTLFLTQLVANIMKKNSPDPVGRRGVIVNIASLSSYTSSPERAEYCISKAAVSMLTKLFADRLAREAISVYEVRPGIIKTNMTAVVTEKYDRLIEGGLLPVKRWGYPEDVANAVLVFAGDKLVYSTGEVINVDGGFHIRRL